MPPASEELGHLLASFPDLDAGETAVDALDAFVLGAAASLSTGSRAARLLSIEEVARQIHANTGLAFESSEIQEVLRRLEDAGQITFTDRDKLSFVVRPHALRDASLRAENRLALEEAVQEEWIGDLIRRRPDLTYEQGELLWSAVSDFVAKMMNARSNEAASFLYVEAADARISFEAALTEARGTLSVQGAPELDDIAIEELIPFVQSATPNRTEYLLSNLNRSFLFHLLSIDPGASRLVRSVVSGKALYADTNFLFRLLALHGPRQAYAPAFIVNIAGDLGSTIHVARATVEEFKSTVKHRASEIRQTWLKREDFRRLAADYPTTDVEFMGQFYREMQQGLVKDPDDFERKYLQVEHALEDWDIEVNEDMPWDDTVLAGLAARVQDLHRWHNFERSLSSCEHDVLMEHYITRSRQDRVGGLNDVDVWFLTYDRRLTRFAYSTVKDSGVPFTLLAGDWLQIVRQFLPRTEDYNAAFLSMVASPLLADDRAVPMKHVVGALDRLQKFQGLSERVAAGMIAEQEFVRRFAQATSLEEETELVEVEAAKIATTLDERIAKLEAQLKERETERDEAAITASTLQSGLEKRSLELKEQSDRIDAQAARIDELAAMTRDLRAERDSARLEAGQKGTVLGASVGENRILRAFVFAASAVIATLVGILLWPVLVEPGKHAVLVFAALAFLVVVAALLWDRATTKKATFWLAVVGLAVAIAKLLG